jgi:hypothetical protein
MAEDDASDNPRVTEDDLQAVLTGSVTEFIFWKTTNAGSRYFHASQNSCQCLSAIW